MEEFKIRYSFFNKLPGICEAEVLQFCLWQVCNCEELSFVVCKEAKYKSGSWQICFQLFWNKSLQKRDNIDTLSSNTNSFNITFAGTRQEIFI